MTTRAEEIDRILDDMRSAIDVGMVTTVDRRKNLMTLARLGLTWEDVKEEMYELSRSDYVSGPSTDRDRPTADKLWVFKKCVLGEKIYIKFKIEYQIDNNLKVLSFHIDEV